MSTWRGWVHGLAAAMISAFFSTVAGTLTMPGTFNLTSEAGLLNLFKLALPQALLSAALYLKQSPLPSFTATVTEKQTISVTKE